MCKNAFLLAMKAVGIRIVYQSHTGDICIIKAASKAQEKKMKNNNYKNIGVVKWKTLDCKVEIEMLRSKG